MSSGSDAQANRSLGTLDGLAMLRNPAYKGAAGFGKTQTAPRQRITRPLRLRGGIASRDSAHHEGRRTSGSRFQCADHR